MNTFLNMQTKELPFTSFLRRVLAGLSLLALSGLAGYGYFSWHQEQRDILEQLSIQAQFMATDGQVVFDNIGDSLLRIGDRIKVGGNLDQFGPLLAAIRRQYPEIGAISIYDPRGRVMIEDSHHPDHPKYYFINNSRQDLELNDAGNFQTACAVGEAGYGIVMKGRNITICATSHYQSGHTFYVSATIHVVDKTAIWSQLPLLPGSFIGIQRDDYFLQAGRSATDVNLTGSQLRRDDPLGNDMLHNPEGGTFKGQDRAAHQYWLGAYARFDHLPLTFVISVPGQLVWQNWVRHDASLFLLLSLFTIIFFCFSLLLLKRERQHSAFLLQQARMDELTGLPNRKAANEYFQHKIALANQFGSSFAVMLLDLDKFKAVNDTMGHAYGDQVLKEVARRLSKGLREEDFLARLGGDEFFALIDCHSRNRAKYAAERLMAAIEEPFMVNGQVFNLTLSIGITIYPEGGSEAQELLKQADSAMYEVKRAGREGYLVFS